MRTHYDLYENIVNNNHVEVATTQLVMTNVNNGFKTYKRLLPKLTTRIHWIATSSLIPVSPLELRSRR